MKPYLTKDYLDFTI